MTIFIFSNPLIAQTVSGFPSRQNIYVYNDLKDTVRLSEINAGRFCFCDSLKIVDTIQIDGVGSKEIVFFRNCNGFIEEHGGTFDISESVTISKYEIWNLDTKQMIFEAINFYNSDYNRFQVYKDPQHTKGVETYSYDFKIDSVGQISISNLKMSEKACKFDWKTVKKKGKNKTVVEHVPYDYYFNPDKTEGTYRYVNGKYIRQ